MRHNLTARLDRFRARAIAGDAVAQRLWAWALNNGLAKPRTARAVRSARHFLARAAYADVALAAYPLAQFCRCGRGGPRDFPRARTWYERAALAGNVEAMYWTAVLYLPRSPQDRYDMLGWEAPRCIRPEDRRDPPALPAANARTGISWLRKAANLNHRSAISLFGCLYNNAEAGLPLDCRLAVDYFRKAAAMGCPAAMTNLGQAYEYGDGVEHDGSRAIEWYKRALEVDPLGSAYLVERLRDIREIMTPPGVDIPGCPNVRKASRETVRSLMASRSNA